MRMKKRHPNCTFYYIEFILNNQPDIYTCVPDKRTFIHLPVRFLPLSRQGQKKPREDMNETTTAGPNQFP